MNFSIIYRSQGSVVGVVMRCGLDGLLFECQKGQKIFLFGVYQGSFRGVKLPGCDVERAPPSNTELENELTRTSLPPACL